MPRPIHFEIRADDPQRAIDFYSKALGWKFAKWDSPMEYWVVSTGPSGEPGIDGGLIRRRDPNQPCVNTIGLENLDRTLESVLTCGGAMTLPKMPVRGMGWFAYGKDTEGHIFGLMLADATVK